VAAEDRWRQIPDQEELNPERQGKKALAVDESTKSEAAPCGRWWRKAMLRRRKQMWSDDAWWWRLPAAAASPPVKISSSHMKPADVLPDLPARAAWGAATRMDEELMWRGAWI